MLDRPGTRIWLLSLALATLMLVVMLLTTGGRFTLPLDDPYIYFQYASQNASGHFFQYNDGDPATTGATSFLYALVLTPMALVFKGAALGMAAFALATLLLAMTLERVYHLAARWLGPSGAGPAVLLTAVSGPFLWGMFSGMETALVAFLAMATVEMLSRLGPGDRDPTGSPFSPRGFAVLAVLFALSRPEAAILLLLLLAGFAAVRRSWPLPGRGLTVTVLVACTLPYLANLLLTGHPGSMTLASKGAVFLPGMSPVTWTIEWTQFFLHNLKGLFASGDATAAPWPSAYTTLVTFAAPLTLITMVLGLFPGCVEEWRDRQPGAAWASTVVITGALLMWAALVPINLHWSRYLMPYLPLVTVGLVAGVWRLADGLSESSGEPVRWGLIGFFVLCALPILLFFAAAYGWNCREIREQHVAMAEWIRANTPPGAIVGTNDVGAIRYYGDRPVLDLHGLVTRDLAACKQVGTGAIYEHVEAMSPAKRPSFLVLIPGWYEPTFVRMLQPVRSQTLRKAMIAGSPLVLYRATWPGAGTGHLPGPAALSSVGPRRLVDRLDVADLESEKDHRYRLDLLPGESASPLAVRMSPGASSPVPDGGRLVTDRESFVLTATPGREAVLVIRSMGDLRADVLVSGEPVAPVRLRAEAPGERWSEVAIPIPGRLIRGASCPIEVVAHNGAHQEGGYLSFHYWLYQ